ncbi:TBC1 domain family member 20 [Sitodiplosis mosellana]|uniref:TBC1 domain family member 20 n=1 Tax=Sitodiplosis mosellana TaxID=263140 RepID=UPI00244485F5|nr:TBC1 domain family member 20 [Sitodiplosis mosellana]
MDKVTEDEEIVKLLDVKDIEFIETSELLENEENDKNSENTKLINESNGINNSDDCGSDQKSNGHVVVCTERRSDEPTELSFEKVPENVEEKLKRQKIEAALADPNTVLSKWQEFAKSEYGLVSDDLRRQVWPRLVGIDPNSVDPAPNLEDLKSHREYNQVILDVNRSLKRFPPGIPYEQRIALQDQLTVLILRVIIKYPHLRYYQGYHDVAITFLLVVGEEVAFHVMEILSTNHLVECMQETMEPTQHRLMYLYPIIRRESAKLCDYLLKSSVGTLFALPWFLTWFGHSLNSYRSVVRLYDYFLASPFLMPLYVTVAIVLYREDDIFKEDCDMASLHCLLSQLPEDLPFEYLLQNAANLYNKHPPEEIEIEVQVMVEQEKQQREKEIKAAKAAAEARRLRIQRKEAAKHSLINRLIPQMMWSRRTALATTAFSIVIGICAYYYKAQFISMTSGIS